MKLKKHNIFEKNVFIIPIKKLFTYNVGFSYFS